MPNSPAIIGTPTNSTVTEDTDNLQTLTALGSISISDANAGQAAFKTTVIAASGDLGSLSIIANGNYVYSVADSKVQYLGAAQTKVDTFTVTSLDGTTKQVSFTIIGVNDAAVIGTPTVVDVVEDATSPTLRATGSISISDADQNQAAFKTAVVSAAGDLGTLVLQSNGSYTYSVADSAVQYLGAGQVKTDTFTVTSLDGTTRQISFNIHGTNDAAVIGTPTVHDVTEDATSPTLTAVGSISISDADQGQAAFKTSVTSASGNLGNLVLAANGTYTYSVADSSVQYLGAGQTKVDTFTVTSLDGTTKQVSFTIHGTNDAAAIGMPTAHDVTEDATNPILYAIGTVSITDADQGQAAFQPALLAGNGNLGALIIGSNGAYIYAVLDSAVQYLGAGDTKVDTFTLTALDGTTKQVTFTIHGTNDAALIGAPTVHDVTEDVNVRRATDRCGHHLDFGRRPEPVLVPDLGHRGRGHARPPGHRRQRRLFLHRCRQRGAVSRRQRRQGRNLHRHRVRRHDEAGVLHHPRRQRRRRHRRSDGTRRDQERIADDADRGRHDIDLGRRPEPVILPDHRVVGGRQSGPSRPSPPTAPTPTR